MRRADVPPRLAGSAFVLAYAVKRLLGAVPTLLVIVTVAFFMIRLAPGGPFDRERPVLTLSEIRRE